MDGASLAEALRGWAWWRGWLTGVRDDARGRRGGGAERLVAQDAVGAAVLVAVGRASGASATVASALGASTQRKFKVDQRRQTKRFR